MGTVCCDRCGVEASSRDLPTHQYAKFDGEVRYLPGDADNPNSCWGRFRQFVTRIRRDYSVEDLRRLDVPSWQSVVDGIDRTVIPLPNDELQRLREWYHVGRVSRNQKDLSGAL